MSFVTACHSADVLSHRVDSCKKWKIAEAVLIWLASAQSAATFVLAFCCFHFCQCCRHQHLHHQHGYCQLNLLCTIFVLASAAHILPPLPPPILPSKVHSQPQHSLLELVCEGQYCFRHHYHCFYCFLSSTHLTAAFVFLSSFPMLSLSLLVPTTFHCCRCYYSYFGFALKLLWIVR